MMLYALRVVGMIIGCIILVPLVIAAICLIVPIMLVDLIFLSVLGFFEWSFIGESEIFKEYARFVDSIKKNGIPS